MCGGLSRASSRWRPQLWLSHLSGPYHRAGRPPLLRSRSPPSGPFSLSSDWRRLEPLRAERGDGQRREAAHLLSDPENLLMDPHKAELRDVKMPKSPLNWQRANKNDRRTNPLPWSFLRKCLPPLLLQLFVLSNHFVRTGIKTASKRGKLNENLKS